jgi:hypothetical protein
MKALYAIAGAFALKSPARVIATALTRAAAQEMRWLRK